MVNNQPGWEWLPPVLQRFEEFPGTQFIGAALVIIIGWYVGRVIIRLTGRRVARRFRRPSITKAVLRSIRLGILLVAVAIAAVVLGLRPFDILLSATVFSVVLGIVLAPVAISLINGLFVLADRPYEIGDLIEIVDQETLGYVENITLRHTKIFTLENTFLVVSNDEMRQRDITNYSAEDARCRRTIDVTVSYEGDLDVARRTLVEAARSVPGVITGGPDIRIGSAQYPSSPRCQVREYGDNGILLQLRYWIREPYHLNAIRSQILIEIWDRFEDIDVSIPYPHSHVVFDETSGLAHVSVESHSSGVEYS